MVFPVQPSDEEAKRRMVVSWFASIKESVVAAIKNKDYENLFFLCQGYCSSRIYSARAVNQEFYNSVLRCMHEALQCHRPNLWASGQCTLLLDSGRPHTALNVNRFLSKHNVTVLQQSLYPLTSFRAIFFCFLN
jgi:hypothetical protein